MMSGGRIELVHYVQAKQSIGEEEGEDLGLASSQRRRRNVPSSCWVPYSLLLFVCSLIGAILALQGRGGNDIVRNEEYETLKNGTWDEYDLSSLSYITRCVGFCCRYSQCMAASSNGNRVAAVADESVVILDLQESGWEQTGEIRAISSSGRRVWNMIKIAMSEDGRTLVVSRYDRVQAYKETNNTWIPLGDMLDGFHAFGDLFLNNVPSFGDSISLSGDMLAIGASYLVSDTKPIYRYGLIRVFRWNGVEWTPVGKTLVSDDEKLRNFGESLSLVGNRMAISMAHPYTSVENGGLVQVYDFDGDWKQIGGDVHVYSAYVSLNSNANSFVTRSGYERRMPILGVFELKNENEWVQKGLGVNGVNGGFAASLSLSGDVLAVGSTSMKYVSRDENDPPNTHDGSLQIFQYNSSSWNLVGDVLGNKPTEGGNTRTNCVGVALSSDGRRVTGGFPRSRELIRVFDWIGT